MSNFQTFGTVTDGLEGSAPARFLASTTDTLAAMLVAGYLNDKKKIVKANDILDVNYLDTSTFPLNTGEAALFASFTVQYDPVLGNWNMVLKSNVSTSISAFGVHAATYSNAGGSATTTITDSSISPNSVVNARWKSSANAVTIETVLPGNGTLTIVSTGDPGVSVLDYISIMPSVALQNQGVVSATYTTANAGAATTFTILNPLITASSIVTANMVSQVNASKIDSVTATAGTITIVVSANPGAVEFSYIAVTPSSALTTLGFYAAAYTNAGGSATTTITDANITVNSIVLADWSTQANAVTIEKVTPGSGSLVILSSGDPGASVLNYSATPGAEGAAAGTFLLAANNLSDVASASAALANIGGLPLAGGQMTGSILLDRGTATSTAGAATVNHQSGVITTEILSTAAASAYSFTLTNSRITTASIVILMLMGGTNTTRGIELRAVPGSGSATLSLYNNNVAGTALNGTLIFGFVVI
jgi:hypothetical protein